MRFERPIAEPITEDDPQAAKSPWRPMDDWDWTREPDLAKREILA
jgi:hypothetical protein